METNVRTPLEIFNQPQHLVIPAFQRPYVWEQEEQWAPLWQDVRRLTELRMSQPGSDIRHFMGAVVVQAQEPVLGGLQASSIIDGQQRLTTLQVLFDAAAATLEEAGLDPLAAQLERLTHNEAIYVAGPGTRLKIRHTNKDRAAFDEVMDADAPVDYDSLDHSKARVVRAHRYFAEAVGAWLDSATDEREPRAYALTDALSRGLQLVAINLTASENSQEIFETLNARGTPLTAADLIRNFVFQKLAQEGAMTRAHLDDWPFESAFWEREISIGRFPMQASSLFFNQWLVARTGDEVSPRATFTRFKQYVEATEREKGIGVAELLPVIRAQADLYEQWSTAAGDPDRQLTRVELATYRLGASDTQLLRPVLIWLHEPDRALPPSVIDEIVALTESWLVRRQLLRLNVGDMGRIVAEMLRVHDKTPAAGLATSFEAFLSRLNVASTYWPGDEEVRTSLRTEQAFRRFKKARLRMLLESVEDAYRRATNQPMVSRRGYPIEHVLPQSWADNWPVEGEEAAQERAEHVHRLGNLTLLTTALNSKVSNGAWPNKRVALQQHDTLLLNSRLLSTAPEGWDEKRIDLRTDSLIDTILELWPVPAGHTGAVIDPHEKNADGWIEVRHLVEAGLLVPGTELVPRAGSWVPQPAVIQPDGKLRIGNATFDTPSGAGKFLRGGATNGWTFWRLPDGRQLREVRAVYTGTDPKKRAFDWSTLHAILEAMPTGRWMALATLAEVIGTVPQPLGAHVTDCRHCTNVHRLVTQKGALVSGFRWSDPDDQRDPIDVLTAEGAYVDGAPDPGRELTSEDLQQLIEQ